MHLSKMIHFCLFVKYDLSQERAAPTMLREDSRRKRGMGWSMVLKAAVRSMMRTAARGPESAERKWSSVLSQWKRD